MWRTTPADAPVTLSALLAGEVRKYRRLVANVRARRALQERYQQAEGVNVLAEDPEALASALGDQRASAAVHYLFEDRVSAYNRRAWAEGHLDLVTATYRWWVDDDGRSGWPPPPTAVVRGWQVLYRDLWTNQAEKLRANADAIAVDDPRLCQPAARVAADELARRQAAVSDHLRQLPLHRRLVASEATLAGDYDARHLVVCTDCGIARHERDDPYGYQHDCCPVREGPLVPAAQTLYPTLRVSWCRCPLTRPRQRTPSKRTRTSGPTSAGSASCSDSRSSARRAGSCSTWSSGCGL